MGVFGDAVSKLFKSFNDLPVQTNQLGDSFSDHGLKVGKMLDDFDATDVQGAAHAADVGHTPDLDLPKLDTPATPDADMSPEELKALELYTGWAHDPLNEYLRGGQARVYTADEMDRMAGALSDGLRALPPFEGRSYRGTRLPPDVLAATQPGGTYADPGFMSSSTDLGTAEQFGAGSDSVMFTIDGLSGRDVDALSTNSGEAEILFDRGTTFDVVSKTQDAQGAWQIHLKER